MGNVQSETTQESETAKDGEERANTDRVKPDRGPSSTKHEPGSRSSGSHPPKSKGVSEPGGVDRLTNGAEMGRNNSKKSKLKLSSMWAQNSASAGMKEASLCDKDPGTEKWGLACLSRADLQNRQSSGSVLQKEPGSLKVLPKPPHGAPSDLRDLGPKRAVVKGKSQTVNVHLVENAGGPLLQLDKLAGLDQATEAPTNMEEEEACWNHPINSSTKDYLDNDGRLQEPLTQAPKQPTSATHSPEPVQATEDILVGPMSLKERNPNRPAPSSCMTPPGGKKALLSWGSGQREKEHSGRPDSAPGSDGDSNCPDFAFQLSAECIKMSSSPVEQPQTLGSDTTADGNNEVLGAEAVSSETLQELLEKGLNFLYKVTIQPGQWPPSIKAVKQKTSMIPSGISYADVVKQCPQKKPLAAAPMLPKALHHLATTGKKLPSFKGLERSNSEEFSSLGQLFLEYLKVPPKESTSQAPNHQVVTFLEDLSTVNTKRPEWQRPRPPTPYPQRRKSQGRKLPKFGTAVSQVVAFLGSDPECEWFVQDESQMTLDEAAGVSEEGGNACIDPPSGGTGTEVVGTSHLSANPLLEQEIVVEMDEVLQRSPRRPQHVDEGTKAMTPLKSAPCSAAWGNLSPVTTSSSFQREEQAPMPVPGLTTHSPNEMPEAASSACPALSTPTGRTADQKAPAVNQERPKVRKQGSVAPKCKEKPKSSGQLKLKAPKGKGQKQWPRGYGLTSPLWLEGVPLFPPFEKVAKPFYFGEPQVSLLDLGCSAQFSISWKALYVLVFLSVCRQVWKMEREVGKALSAIPEMHTDVPCLSTFARLLPGHA